MTLDDDVEGAARAHQVLLSRLDSIESDGPSDLDVRRPSLLPDWTVGHVLAHLTLNAESFVHVFENAADGVAVRQYPGGARERNAHIERDSILGFAEHVKRLRLAVYRLEGSWSRAGREWDGSMELSTGTVVSVRDVPLRRWREVEVHMGDLGLPEWDCSGPASWSQEYIRRDVRVLTMQWQARGSMGMNSLPPAVARLDDRWRLAWLLGRHEVDGVDRAGLW